MNSVQVPARHLPYLAMKARPSLLIAATMASACASLRGAERPVTAWEGRTMGSVYTVKLVEPRLPPAGLVALRAEVEARLAELNRQMSHYDPDSELSRFNRAPAKLPFPVSPEFAKVVRFSLELSRRSGGAFDPTLGPVINLWGFGEKSVPRAVPPEPALQAARALTGWRHLAVTPAGELVKELPGLSLNLGGVAKGFGTDEIVAVLRRHGITDAYVAIAGEVRVTGRNARAEKWHVGIAAPVDHWRADDPMATGVRLADQSLSTSGDYQNFYFDPRGGRLCHIIDPRTGWPVQHLLGGVSVVAPDSMSADALGTALFVLGPVEGLKWIDAWEGAAALFIVRQPDGSFRRIPSARFAAMTGD